VRKWQRVTGPCVLPVVAALLAACNDSDSAPMSSVAQSESTPQSASTRQGTDTATTRATAAGAGAASSGGKIAGGTPGSATLSWEAPTSNTNGSALTDLSGYRIYYGPSASDLSETVQIGSVGVQTFVIENLQPGTWYFAIRALASDGTESSFSDIVEKTIG